MTFKVQHVIPLLPPIECGFTTASSVSAMVSSSQNVGATSRACSMRGYQGRHLLVVYIIIFMLIEKRCKQSQFKPETLKAS